MAAGREQLRDPRLSRLFWTLLDQGVVSAGTFVVQLTLARNLPPAQYGIFVLIFGGLLTLQLCNGTLLFHPMSVRIAAAPADQRGQLLGASLLMLAVTTGVLGALLVVALMVLGHRELALPSLACLLAWQAQEGLRRGLLSSFRHSVAMIGDVLSYVGQAEVAIGLATLNLLTVQAALYGITICAAMGALVHGRQLAITLPTRERFRAVLIDYWSIGGLPSLANGLVSTGRMMMVPWALAAFAGPGAAAGYQAVMNVVNLSNPLVLGLANIIPQAAASASREGYSHAWRSVRGYLLLAAPLILAYSSVIFAVPNEALRLFYSGTSQYVLLTVPLRLLILVGLTGFLTEAVLSFLHGLALVRRAAAINIAGTALSLALALPAIKTFGLTGGCVVLLLANLLRLVLVRMALARLAAAPQNQPA